MCLINKAACRKFALDYAQRTGRGDVVKAVSNDVYPDLESKVRAAIRGMVDAHPGSFKTLKPQSGNV